MEENGNITVEGWKEGDGYLCDDVKHNKERTFRCFSESHTQLPAQSQTEHTLLVQGVLIGTIVTTTIFIFLGFFIFKRRFYVMYWFSRKRRGVGKKDAIEYEYDIFISYNSNEKDWVIRKLLPFLEDSKPKLRACIRERDFKVRYF